MNSTAPVISNKPPTHSVSVYRRAPEVARADCTCGWGTGLQDDIEWVMGEAAEHERRISRIIGRTARERATLAAWQLKASGAA